MNKEDFKNTKFCKTNTKVNNLERKIPDAYTLIETNQYNIPKQKMMMLRTKYDIKKIILTSSINKFLLHY